MKKFARIALTACLLLGIAAQANAVDFKLNTPPAKAGGFTVATKVAFRLKPVWPLLKQAEVIPPQFGRFHLHLPVA